jgi:hypothetical protein
VEFLRSEVRFNNTLSEILVQINKIKLGLDAAEEAAMNNLVVEAISKLMKVDSGIETLESFEYTRVVFVLKDRASHLRTTLLENLNNYWGTLISVDHDNHSIAIQKEIQSKSTS